MKAIKLIFYGEAKMNSHFSDEMQDLIERSTGMPIDDIRKKDIDEVHRSIEKQISKKLEIGKEPCHQGRGSMLIQLGRTISRDKIESDFNNYFG